MLTQHILLALLPPVLVSSQSTTVVSLFLNSPVAGVSTGATGYVVDANPTATTYVLDCVKALCVGSKRAEYARVTAAPGSQEYNEDNDGTTIHQTCSFDTASTEATCLDTTLMITGDSTEGYYATVTYVPVPPTSRGQQNIFSFPGLQPVLITSGVDKLAGTASAVATTTTMTTGASASTTGSSASNTATGTAANHAASYSKFGQLSCGIVALAALAIVL